MCVSDIAFALPSALRAPRGDPRRHAAQIAPFVVARPASPELRAALTGARFNADSALSYGLVHEVCAMKEPRHGSLRHFSASAAAHLKRGSRQSRSFINRATRDELPFRSSSALLR